MDERYLSHMVYRFIFFPACVTVGRHRVSSSNMCNILRKAQISENSTFYHSISKQRLMSIVEIAKVTFRGLPLFLTLRLPSLRSNNNKRQRRRKMVIFSVMSFVNDLALNFCCS